MSQRKNLKGLSRKELEAFFADLGESPYRARQVMVWMYHRWVSDFSLMTDLSKELRGKLEEIAIIRDLREKGRKTAPDGTVKFLYETARGDAVETVLMH